MGEKTGISWANSTWNPWWGCVKVSPGCEHCYAETFANRYGHTIWGPAKTTTRRTFGEMHWNQPRLWNRKAAASGEPWRVFCASMADVFEVHPQLDAERERLWALIEETPYLTWQLLTKRPRNIKHMLPERWSSRVPDNVWLGTSVESQDHADRIGWLWETRAPVYWVSYEPALGPVDFVPYLRPQAGIRGRYGGRGLDWIIIGGESGASARPFNLWWAVRVVEQCRLFGAAPFVKQLGRFPRWGDAPYAFKDRKGADPAEWPAPLRVQEFPASGVIQARA